jgi:hypothetical protein
LAFPLVRLPAPGRRANDARRPANWTRPSRIFSDKYLVENGQPFEGELSKLPKAAVTC